MRVFFNNLQKMSILGALMIASQGVFAQHYADGLYFSESDGKAMIIRGDQEYKGRVVIPEVLIWYEDNIRDKDHRRESTVTSVSFDAFENCKELISVTLPNSIDPKELGYYHGCTALQEVVLPESFTELGNFFSLYYPYGTFEGCTSLTSINIPKHTKVIAARTFYGCSSLKVDFPDDIEYVGDSAFVGCNFTSTSLTIPYHEESEYYDPVGIGAFFNTNLLTLIYNAKNFVDCSLGGCKSLKKLIVGPQVESITSTLGDGEGLESITVDPNNSLYDSRENCNAIINTAGNELVAGFSVSTIPSSVESIGYWAFKNCAGLKHIEFPSSLKRVDRDAFAGSGLEEVTIPASIDWGESIFQECHQLKSVTLPEGLTVIPFSMFEKCDALESVTIPSTMKDIGKMAFYGCTSLKSVKSLAQDAPKMRDNTFSKVTYENCPLYIRADAINYSSGYWWYKFKNVVKFTPDNVSAIANRHEPLSVYTLDGLQVVSPQHGVNVLQMSDGTKKKVVVK